MDLTWPPQEIIQGGDWIRRSSWPVYLSSHANSFIGKNIVQIIKHNCAIMGRSTILLKPCYLQFVYWKVLPEKVPSSSSGKDGSSSKNKQRTLYIFSMLQCWWFTKIAAVGERKCKKSKDINKNVDIPVEYK